MVSKEKLTKMIIDRCRDRQPPHIVQPNSITSDWILRQSGMPYMPLSVDIPTDQILLEIKKVEHLLVDHREDYEEHQGWTSFCIHGKSYDSTREDEYYNNNRPYIWTPEALSLMPKTVEFFKNNWFGNSFKRLRIMRLAPGGYIFLHRDGTDSHLGPVNIAITQPQGCEFVFEDHGVVPFSTGRAYILDISNRHCVMNNSAEYRYHIIAHHLTTTDEYNTMLVESYASMLNA
jgi:hypothetical protein